MTTGQKFDGGKVRPRLLPPFALITIAKVLDHGADKYGEENWRKLENADKRYLDATLRHVLAYMAGQSTDPDSGLPHLAHAACSLMFMLELSCLNEFGLDEKVPHASD